ncbi:hypothetical protein FZEAL_4078 [Fusarium zealandicum]|uniref:Sulfatase N-terminal domain-containing protein n=1 Tax=Fusarium zealandicum TaxID=1053134 RepID=A0A8H4XL65_9HYPO|nr:hypothetical protein FZEAL_4078 [Fusarium zealandicum]
MLRPRYQPKCGAWNKISPTVQRGRSNLSPYSIGALEKLTPASLGCGIVNSNKDEASFVLGRVVARPLRRSQRGDSCLAPHWPLQAPKEKWQKYTGVYDDGPEKLGERRVQRLKDLGLVPQDVNPAKPEGWGIDEKWEDLTELERKESFRKMEVFAGIVDAMDEGIAQVLDHLESTGELDNTFVLFMSDNGAEGVMLEALPVMGNEATMADIIHAYYDNSLDNIGSGTSFTWYPGFSSAPEAITHSFTSVMDAVPTVLELAGVQHPGTTFHGREVEAVRGNSWVSHLNSQDHTATLVQHKEEHVHGWELVGLRAIRKGPWKAVWMHAPRGQGK